MNTFRVATIDLDAGTCGEERFDEALMRAYLGGGLGVEVLRTRTCPDTDALAPDSVLCILNGLLVGTGVPAASKLTFYARSPLTGIWGESTVGGHWPAILRTTGFDGLIIRGGSAKPVVIRLEEDGAHLDAADTLWGKDTFETFDRIREVHREYAVACIGPAGEMCVPMASIMADGRIARAAGRGGLGAVLGSKRVKAVIAHGSLKVAIEDREGLRDSIGRHVRTITQHAERLREFGTAGGVAGAELAGDLPIKNWQLRRWKDGAGQTTAQSFFPEHLDRHHTCHSCPIRCGKILRQRGGRFDGSVSHGPEYETVAGFGACCLVDDHDVIMAANEYCNRNGIDTISSSAAIAFAMEAFEKGLISADDAGGKAIRWGDGETVLRLLEEIATRTGLGALLGQGVRHAASVLGADSDEFAVHIKGMEIPLHDPRAFPSMAVSYALAARGGDHLEGMSYMYEKGLRLPGYGYQGELVPSSLEHKVRVAHENVDYYAVFNALGLCKFLSIGKTTLDMIAEWVGGVTGWGITRDELLTTGRRLTTAKRLYNLARGVTAADDILPPRLMKLRGGDQPDEGIVPDTATMIGEEYQLRGWDANGVPTAETLEALGLSSGTER